MGHCFDKRIRHRLADDGLRPGAADDPAGAGAVLWRLVAGQEYPVGIGVILRRGLPGLAALVIAEMLGPRKDFPHGFRPPHAPWMVMVGASLLWVGWFGFNGGSALASGADAGMAMLTTHLSAAAATLVWMTIEWISFGKPR